METRDWRHGWAADDPRWTDDPAAAQWALNNGGSNHGGSAPRAPRQPFGDGPVDEPPSPHDGWGGPDLGSRPLAITASPGPQPVGSPQPVGGPPAPVQPGFGLVALDRTGDRPAALTSAGWTARTRPDVRIRRRRRGEDDEFRRTSRAELFGEEPRYRSLFGLTAAWYAIPAVIYLCWLLIVGGGRQGSVGQQVLASLPWLLAAVALSIAVAGLLRWAVVGWRALTLSFAAAVIGAGVATIAHSVAG